MSEPPRLFTLASFVAACCTRVARLPTIGESVRADAFSMEAGGKGFNVAVGLHRLGFAIDGLIPIGDDYLADFATRAVMDAGLPASMLTRLEGATGAGVGFIDPAGENQIAVFPGANDILSAATVAAAAVRIVGAAGVIAGYEIGDDPIRTAFSIARAAGVPTFLNPSPYRPLSKAILATCDVLVVNRNEALLLERDLGGASMADSGPSGRSAMTARVFAEGVRALVMTDGANGATLCRPDAPPLHQSAFAIRPVDTVGAGDAFLAGLAATRASGGEWDEAMRVATICGAIVASRHGVLTALPTRGEVENFERAHAQAG